MPLALYMDHHVPRAITLGLRLRGVDVMTSWENGSHELSDPDILDRATELHRVLFTQDDDLLGEATKRQKEARAFAGVVYAHQLRVSIGMCVQDLEFISKVGEPKDLKNQILFLPL